MFNSMILLNVTRVNQLKECVSIYLNCLCKSPEDANIIFCGYSLGGYLILLASREESFQDKVAGCLLLCPAIDRNHKFIYND